MRPGVISCGPEADLITVARLMAANRVHCVVVSGVSALPDGGEHLTWGLISAHDLAEAALPGDNGIQAGALAASEIVTVDAADSLERAAQLMVEHGLSHVLVVDRGRPVGVVSTLDVAAWLAGEEPVAAP
jgi:CBS domain-containing protein